LRRRKEEEKEEEEEEEMRDRREKTRRLRGRRDARRREAFTIREGTRPSARRAFFPLGGTKVETLRMAIY